MFNGLIFRRNIYEKEQRIPMAASHAYMLCDFIRHTDNRICIDFGK